MKNKTYKLITLNCWGGHELTNSALLEFLKDNQDIDFYCFQEVYNNAEGKEKVTQGEVKNLNLFSGIKKALPDHDCFFDPYDKSEDYFGLAFATKHAICQRLAIQIHKDLSPEDYPRPKSMQSVRLGRLSQSQFNLSILNLHGLRTGINKRDSVARIHQSNIIKSHILDLFLAHTPAIICGDFNLEPDTESLKIIKKLGFQCLVTKYNIKSTRTFYYTKECKFADYIFISRMIKVIDFKVLPDILSDHAALYLEFKIPDSEYSD